MGDLTAVNGAAIIPKKIHTRMQIAGFLSRAVFIQLQCCHDCSTFGGAHRIWANRPHRCSGKTRVVAT